VIDDVTTAAFLRRGLVEVAGATLDDDAVEVHDRARPARQ
jgi:hypothetical protein